MKIFEYILQALKSTRQQIFLVAKMGIKSGPPDIGAVYYFLYGDRLKFFFED